MPEPASEELKEKVLEYLGTVSKTKNRDMAKKLGVEKKEVDQAVNCLLYTSPSPRDRS